MKAKELSEQLLKNHNIILRGAPGTGKTHLAHEIAEILTGVPREELSESDQFEMVQFHPSYDYTDFVEGLRPITGNNENGQIGFELKEGIFQAFCKKSRSKTLKGTTKNADEIWNEFISNLGDDPIEINNYSFKPNSVGNITYIVPGGSTASLTLDNVRYYLEHQKWGSKNYHSTYKQPIFDKYLKDKIGTPEFVENDKKYIFIIDEINRGEISKIFGELFFSIDPGYRGKDGKVKTQYSSMKDEEDQWFYIPENVYIIGTMNDIDRSVDTFDFAMRRRFTFIEITAEDSQKAMLNNQNTMGRMNRLNKAILETGLTTDYQIGASNFLSLENQRLTVNELWKYKLEPLLKDYYRGERDATSKLEKLKLAYDGKEND